MVMKLELDMTNSNELKWLARYRTLVGFLVNRFDKVNPIFISYINKAFKESKLRPILITVDSSLSGALLGGVFTSVGMSGKIPRTFYRIKDWLDAGIVINSAAYGCIAVIKTEQLECVGVVVGQTSKGLIKVLGIHSEGVVSIEDYNLTDILGYRWVGETKTPSLYRYDLPVLKPGSIKTKLP